MRSNTGFKLLFFLVLSVTAGAQLPETDIFIAKMNTSMGLSFSDFRNITNRKGYDNQPSFTPDGKKILFVSIADTLQSDVYAYSLIDGKTSRISSTKESEYSPTLNEKEWYTVVRVDADSGQRLYRFKDASNAELVKNTDSIGYYCRLTDSTIAMFILGSPHSLQILNTSAGTRSRIDENIGRCLRLSPSGSKLYYVRKTTDKEWHLCSYNLRTKKIETIILTPEGSEDFAFLPDGTVIIGKDATLYKLEDDHWTSVADFSRHFKSFYRIAVNKDGTMIALVCFMSDKP